MFRGKPDNSYDSDSEDYVPMFTVKASHVADSSGGMGVGAMRARAGKGQN